MQTPYYVIRKNILDGLFYELKTALDAYWPNYKIGYSFNNSVCLLIHTSVIVSKTLIALP